MSKDKKATELELFLSGPITKESAHRFLLGDEGPSEVSTKNWEGKEVDIATIGIVGIEGFHPSVHAHGHLNKHHLKAMLFLIEEAEINEPKG